MAGCVFLSFEVSVSKHLMERHVFSSMLRTLANSLDTLVDKTMLSLEVVSVSRSLELVKHCGHLDYGFQLLSE